MQRFYGPDGRYAPDAARLRPDEISARMGFWLVRLGMSEQRDSFPAQLSGGQQQRVAIARTLAMRPDLLLVDEPFSPLDAMAREDLERLTLELCAETGLTTIIVTHSIDEAVYMGTQLLLLCQPPHRQELVVQNPGAGHKGYRGQAAFPARCRQVRVLLEGRADAQA